MKKENREGEKKLYAEKNESVITQIPVYIIVQLSLYINGEMPGLNTYMRIK
jgi:hypothetical protein